MKLFFMVLTVAVVGGVFEQGRDDTFKTKSMAGLSQMVAVAADHEEFDPLRDVLLQRESEESNFYIGQRCVAVGFVSVKLFEGNPALQEDNEKVRSKTVKLITAIVGDWGPSNGISMTVEEFMSELAPIIELYKAKVKESFVASGNPRSEFLLEDLNICKDLYWSLLD